MKILLLLLIPLFLGKGEKNEKEENNSNVKHADVSLRKKMKLAKYLAGEGSYYNAVDYFADVVEDKENNTRVINQLAELNRSLRDYKEAEFWYAKLVELKDSNFPLAQFHLARMMKMNGKYEEAKEEFGKFMKGCEGDDCSTYKTLAEKEVEGCDYAITAMNEPTKAEINHVEGEVNNGLQEFSPRPMGKDKMMFASLVSDTALPVEILQKKGEDYYAKLFTVERKGDEWVKANELPSAVNQAGKHVGNGALSEDGNTLYYTMCDEDELLNMKCKIYKAEKSGGMWGDAEELSINEDDATTTQPAIGKDAEGREVLYFVSDREKGRGGMDIWYSVVNDKGNLGKPENLGKEINTKGDEITPFYDLDNGVLYFSSTGHPGVGGLDIFKTEGNIGAWGEITNLGFPVNSSSDDLYLALSEEGEIGFMVSNRPGTNSNRGETCCDDIFHVDLIGKRLFIKAYFASKSDSTLKIGGVQADFTAGETDEALASMVTTSEAAFIIEVEPGGKYKIKGEKEGYWPVESVINAPEKIKRSDTLNKIFYIELLKPKIKIGRVYFAFDRSNVREQYAAKMDTIKGLLDQYPDWMVEIVGHTDSKGSETYNQKLSEKRSKEAAKYLISAGIDKERILSKGAGESKPIAENEVGGKDNPKGRAKNRRVDFKFLTEVGKEADVEIEYDDAGPSGIE